MLKKLLRYDLKSIFKLLIIFYSLALFFALLTRIFFSIENSIIMNIIGKICSGTAISMMFSILINNLMRICVVNNMKFLNLEVRESNCNAISLYSKLGFEKVGLRKNYYKNPNENAVLMTKYLVERND